jgi:hypothetical protein
MCFYFFLFEKVESFRISQILSLIWSCKRLETNYLGKTIAFLFYSDQNDKWRFPTIKELEDLSTRCQKMSNFLQDDKTRSNLLSVLKRFLIISARWFNLRNFFLAEIEPAGLSCEEEPSLAITVCTFHKTCRQTVPLEAITRIRVGC